jgi:hypothetical protein
MTGLMAAYHYQQGDRPLDGYTIRYALGRGGFGEVYFAVTDAGREVALKAVQNFEEVELRGIGHCMNLKSPHLVMIFDIKHAVDGTPWVIMEYVSGPSLRDVLDESPEGLGGDQAKFFVRELGKGLSYLHEAGVVHRDLKPHNVFFEDGIVKIGDYSLSKVITASHRSGNTMTVGSVHYMAPEISLGRYDKTVDIYALGVMLYEMVAGQPPYVGESMGEVLMKHLSSDPDVSQLPEPFAGAIVKAMQRDPADRYQTAQEMVEAVVGAVPREPLHDSFNPTTLSMVGERARTARAERAALQASVPDVAVDVAPPLSHSTAPTAVQETGSYTAADRNTAAEQPTAARSIPILQRLGLQYSLPGQFHSIPDATWLAPRLFLAALATMILILFSLKTASGDWSGRSVLGVVAMTFLLSVATATIARRFPLLHVGIGGSLLSRFGWSLPVLVAWFVALEPMRIDDELCGPLACSVLVCTALFDWRCLISVHRQPRVSLLAVVSIGVVAAVSHLMMSDFTGWTPFAGALAMAAAITVQLVAPLNRPATNAPMIRRMPKARPPRLLYDRTALALELVIGIAVAIVASLFVSGEDDGGFIALGVIAASVAIFALRLRLQRRAWSDEQRPSAQNEHGLHTATAHESAGLDDSLQPIKRFDRTITVLEGIIGVAMAVVVGLLINGEDDGGTIAVGVIAGVVGVFALRLRKQRRVWLNGLPVEQPNTGRAETEVTPRTGETVKPVPRTVQFDKTSAFLELMCLSAVALVGALMFAGGDDLFPVGAVGAAAGLLALRFRYLRHRHIWRTADLSWPRPNFDGTTVFLELLMAACAMVIAIVVSIGDDDFFGFAAVAAVLAIVAVRFRHSRRIVSERLAAATSDQRDEDDTPRRNKEMQGIR